MENGEIYLFLKSINQLEYFNIIIEKGGYKTLSSFEGIDEKELDEDFKKIGIGKLLCRKTIIKSIFKKISEIEENSKKTKNNISNIEENKNLVFNKISDEQFKNLIKISENDEKKNVVNEVVDTKKSFEDEFDLKELEEDEKKIEEEKKKIEQEKIMLEKKKIFEEKKKKIEQEKKKIEEEKKNIEEKKKLMELNIEFEKIKPKVKIMFDEVTQNSISKKLKILKN
jgi:hypothetical protein